MSPSTIIIITAFSLAILAAIGLGQLERFGNWRRDQARLREIEIHKKLWGNRLDRRMLGDYGPLTAEQEADVRHFFDVVNDGISKYENDGLLGAYPNIEKYAARTDIKPGTPEFDEMMRLKAADHSELQLWPTEYDNVIDKKLAATLTDLSAMADVESLSDEQLFGTPFPWDVMACGLEDGGFYRTRDGRVVGPLRQNGCGWLGDLDGRYEMSFHSDGRHTTSERMDLVGRLK